MAEILLRLGVLLLFSGIGLLLVHSGAGYDCLMFIMAISAIPLATLPADWGKWKLALLSFNLVILAAVCFLFSPDDREPISSRLEKSSEIALCPEFPVMADERATSNVTLRKRKIPGKRESVRNSNPVSLPRPRHGIPFNPGIMVVDGMTVREVCVNGLVWMSQTGNDGHQVLVQVHIPDGRGNTVPKTCATWEQ